MGSRPMAFSVAILLFLLASATQFVSGDDKLSAYDVLQKYDFPVGVLPKGVTGYELDPETGKFKVYLNETCKFSVQSYELEYKSTITGVITKGKLKNLKGVKVFVLLLWLNIVEVSRDGDELDLSVGIASANFPLDSFVESPQCGCGFDCANSLDRLLASA